MSGVRAKKKPERSIAITEGEWTVFINGVGFVRCKFRAHYEDDPEGFYGHGRSVREAEKNLAWYAEGKGMDE